MTRPNGNPRSPPRYRVEERCPDLAAFIVGFADTTVESRVLRAELAVQVTRARMPAELVVIDQDTDVVVLRRDVWMPSPS